MATLIIRFLNLLMAGLVAGTIFGIWLGYNPEHLSAYTYIEQQQNVIAALNVIMPVLGMITILLTLLSALLGRKNRTLFITLLIAAGLFIVSGLITRFGNQPVNSIIIGWDKTNAPADWTLLRDRWWALHACRTLTACLGFCLLIGASMRRG